MYAIIVYQSGYAGIADIMRKLGLDVTEATEKEFAEFDKARVYRKNYKHQKATAHYHKVEQRQ